MAEQKMKELMDEKYSNYANYTNNNRAVPSIIDGLKPVQKRILYSMYLEGGERFIKSAKHTGNCMSSFHPHGDSSIYETMVLMAQTFNNNPVYIESQGNWGSIFGDNAADMRYTECKLSDFSKKLMLSDLKYNVHEVTPNYDDSTFEPVVIPVKTCNYLLHGSFGIGVGLSVNIPPHNIIELTKTVIKYAELKKSGKEVKLDELLKILKGPDFPTGGTVKISPDDLKSIYEFGTGKYTLYGNIDVNEPAKELVITSMPFRMTTDVVKKALSGLIEDGKLDVVDIIDKSKTSVNICIKTKAREDLYTMKEFLLEKVLSTTIGVKLRAVEYQDTIGLIEILSSFVNFRIEFLTKVYNKKKIALEKDIHLLNGLIIVIADIKKVVDIIINSANPEDDLKKKYKLTDLQVEYIMNIKLKQLKKLEVEEIKNSLVTKSTDLSNITDLLNNVGKMYDLVIAEQDEILKMFKNNKRLTKII